MNHERRRIHRLDKVLDEGHKVHFRAAGGLPLGSTATKRLRVPLRRYS
jgi:hypothetical protein